MHKFIILLNSAKFNLRKALLFFNRFHVQLGNYRCLTFSLKDHLQIDQGISLNFLTRLCIRTHTRARTHYTR